MNCVPFLSFWCLEIRMLRSNSIGPSQIAEMIGKVDFDH